jgi:hypothetical protein
MPEITIEGKTEKTLAFANGGYPEQDTWTALRLAVVR